MVTKNSFRGLRAALVCMVSVLAVLPAFAGPVSISQSGSTVTAGNGSYTLTFNLVTGKGNLSYGATALITDFYSDFKPAASPNRVYATDSGTRTASWASIGSSGYGTGGYKLTLSAVLSSGYTIKTNYYLYANTRFFLVDMEAIAASATSIDFLEPVAAYNLNIGNFGDERVLTAPYTNNDDFGVAPVDNYGSFTGTSYWVSSVFDNTNHTGFVAGAATTTNWKSAQYLASASTPNGPLNGFSVYNNGGTQSGTAVKSDKFFLGYYSDYRDGLEEYGRIYAVGEAPMSWSGAVPIGYNNWYALRAKDPLATMYNVVDYVDKNLKSLGYKYVNLDATSLDFAGKQSFVNYTHSKGLKAGAYTCPFIVWDSIKNDTIPGTSYHYSDAILKDSSGNDMTWYLGSGAFVLDTTHPAGQAAVASFVNDLVNAGVDYVKLDFLDYGMQEGAHYDAAKNGMQAYRAGMQIVKNIITGAGRPIFVSESIAPLFPNGYAHARRAACDTEIGISGKNYAGYGRQAFNAVASWFTNGTIWKYNDADMAMVDNYVGSEYWLNVYSQNHARLLNAYVATGGGLWLASENLPLVPKEKMDQVLLNPSVLAVAALGKAGRPVRMTNFLHLNEDTPPITYMCDSNGDKIVVAANWSKNASASVTVNWADIGLSASGNYYVTDLFRNEKLGRFVGSYTATFKGSGQDALLLRISSAAPAQPAPATNLALSKTFSASSIYSAGWEADKSGDGAWGTRWSAGANSGQWLEVDLGSSTNVNRVVLKEFKDSENFGTSYTVSDFSVQYWNGSTYVNIAKDSKIGFEKVVTFPTVNTSKVRISFAGAWFLPSIREFEVYYVPGAALQTIAQDDSDAAMNTYADIRLATRRMQVFRATATTLSRFDVFAYKTGGYAGPLNVTVYSLDGAANPSVKLFEANILPDNFPGGLQRMPVYSKITGLTVGTDYGIVLSSPASPDTSNCYGFGYSDSDPLPNAYERVSGDGGATWATESSGARDLKITLFQ